MVDQFKTKEQGRRCRRVPAEIRTDDEYTGGIQAIEDAARENEQEIEDLHHRTGGLKDEWKIKMGPSL